MKLSKTEGGWVINVPDQVVEMIGLVDGQRVTIRPVPRPEDEIRHWMTESRGNLPDYPFDRWDREDDATAEPA